MRKARWALPALLALTGPLAGQQPPAGKSDVGQQWKDEAFIPPTRSQLIKFDDKSIFPLLPDKPKDPPKLWSGGLEAGFSGSEGNSDFFKARLATNVKRQTEGNIWTADLLYGLNRQNDVNSENKALFNTRDEVLFAGTTWGLFGAGQLEYDQFRAYDFRVALHTGVAYQILKSDTVSLRGRVGAGFSREIGGPQDRYVPEGLLGGDFIYRLTEWQRFVSTADFYPDLGHLGEYRVRLRAAYEILIAPEWGLTLRLGVQDRYDSNPGDARRNDFDYFTTLLLKF